MPDINPQNTEHSALEADIEKLGKEIAEKRNLPEYKGLSEKEIIKKTLQPMIKQPTIQSAHLAEPISVEKTFFPNYLKDSPVEIKLQVEKLIDSVFHYGIEKTVKEARQAGAFVLDAFHDALTDKLYEELKNRRLI